MISIRTKFILLITISLFSCITLLGTAGIISTKKTIDDYSAEYMNLECNTIAAELNGTLEKIEQSVQTLSDYAKNNIGNIENLKTDNDYFEKYVNRMENIALNSATHTQGAISAYMRFNMDYWEGTSGFVLTKTSSDGKIIHTEPTDLSEISPNDTEHAGWYYLPQEKGEAIWTMPYLNKKINVYIISYAIPIYCEGDFIAVVGMDIDFSVFTDLVAQKTIYHSGYAFLISSDAHTMYHTTAPGGIDLGTVGDYIEKTTNKFGVGTSGRSLIEYKRDSEKRKMAFRNLRNDIYVALTAPASEINHTRDHLIIVITSSGLIFLTIVIIITIIISRKITKPILELNEAAQKMIHGDLNVTINSHPNDEIGTLINNFKKTVEYLREYIGYINGLAYIDNMTGVKNKTAYAEAVARLEKHIDNKQENFGVIVFDINDLKIVNDNYGHEAGDELIIGSCRVICRTFVHSPVYRIGGDEFVVILENEDFENIEKLMKELTDNVEKANKNKETKFNISIAAGYVPYSSEIDNCYSDVFKRADEKMYINKSEIKKRKKEIKSDK